MPSIRRSLLGYLLLLLVLALGGVGVLVYQFAKAAMNAREKAETERIEQAYQLRADEAQKKFDADLVAEAHNTWEMVRNRLYSPTILGSRFAGVGAAIRPTEDDVQGYQKRVAAFASVVSNAATAETLRSRPPGSEVGPRPAPGGPRPGVQPDRITNHFWVAYYAPRVTARIQEGLRRSFEDEEPRYRCEFHVSFVLSDPGHTYRSVATAFSPGLAGDIPFDLDAFDRNPKLEHSAPDDISGQDGTTLRRVTVRVSPGTGGRAGQQANPFWLPPPVLGKGQPPLRPSDLQARVFIQCVLPRSILADRLAQDVKDRDDQLAAVRTETHDQLALLRARLGLIGGGTFLALVVGGWLIVARGLFPMRKLSEAVSQVSEKDFRLPIEPADLSRELAPIHARITQTLDQLRRAFAREKQAVADISHELRTPIASLQATLDVALRKPRTPEQYRTTLEDCRAICKQLGQLVERIMVLASLDAGTARTVRTRSDAADIAAGCAAVIRPLAASHGLEFASRVAAPLELDTDPDKLREVLVNLLHNAVEYNKPGGRIDLHGRRENGSVVLEVRDTGIGMAADVKDRIFERFYRADASRQATGVHAGLGLAIVKEYVERLGGAIAVESEPGAGSTFRVTLPAPADVPAEPEFPAEESADEAVPSGS